MCEFVSGHPDLALTLDTPVILIPFSDSAIHLSKLSENEEKLTKLSFAALLGRLTPSSKKLKEKRSPETATIELEPTAETSQYNLGSDKRTNGTTAESEISRHKLACSVVDSNGARTFENARMLLSHSN
jgi:hypothetical protein